jgi:hypothetical protein
MPSFEQIELFLIWFHGYAHKQHYVGGLFNENLTTSTQSEIENRWNQFWIDYDNCKQYRIHLKLAIPVRQWLWIFTNKILLSTIKKNPQRQRKKSSHRHINNKIMYSMWILITQYHNFKCKYRWPPICDCPRPNHPIYWTTIHYNPSQ